MGLKATAHAHGTNGMNAALRLGVDAIEHGTFLDEETIRLFKSSGAYLVPTLMPSFFIGPLVENPSSFLLPPQREKARIAVTQAMRFAREAHSGGVKVAFGSDAGLPHSLHAAP